MPSFSSNPCDAPLSVAIDGPAGAGKSTVAKELAARLNMLYLDTGAMYRSLAWLAMKCGISWQDETALLSLLRDDLLQVQAGTGGTQILYQGRVITSELYGPEVSRGASLVAQHPQVRSFLVSWQRCLAVRQAAVLDGRDIGTAVLPWAGLKIFLTASPSERAVRRLKDLPCSGLTLEEMEAELVARDERDSKRSIAPLRPAEDAVLIDSTGREVTDIVQEILNLLRERDLWKGE